MVNRGEVVVKCVVNRGIRTPLFSGLKLRHRLQLFFRNACCGLESELLAQGVAQKILSEMCSKKL
jgi:hypothetical protein